MTKILENLELLLTAAGLLVIFAVHYIWEKNDDTNSWMLAAATATAVGVIHGVIFWLVRRRQRHVRRLALSEARHMLKDIVNNQLCVIQFTSDLPKSDPFAARQAGERITESIRQINATLDNISEESLIVWKQKYAKAVGTFSGS